MPLRPSVPKWSPPRDLSPKKTPCFSSNLYYRHFPLQILSVIGQVNLDLAIVKLPSLVAGEKRLVTEPRVRLKVQEFPLDPTSVLRFDAERAMILTVVWVSEIFPDVAAGDSR